MCGWFHMKRVKPVKTEGAAMGSKGGLGLRFWQNRGRKAEEINKGF
jgi:hypothetical protein